MMKEFMTQSQKRFNESIGSLFGSLNQNDKTCLFLKSSSDEGVIRNGGRNGARFAPQSFLSTFKKFTLTEKLKNYNFFEVEVSNQDEEKWDFHKAQDLESERIKLNVEKQKFNRIYHLGGGHDHIYPLIRALTNLSKKLIIINLDAHADTRNDLNFHSGTPFRQIATNHRGEFHLFQIGLHPFSNSFSTLEPLKNGNLKVMWRKNMTETEIDLIFKEIYSLIDKDSVVILSIDADVMSASEVPGVSAVNPNGILRSELLKLWLMYCGLPLNHCPITGIYELNPIYDSLASLSMKTMGSLLFETL